MNRTCSNCGVENIADAKYCTVCGRAMADQDTRFTKGHWAILIGTLCLALFIVFAGFLLIIGRAIVQQKDRPVATQQVDSAKQEKRRIFIEEAKRLGVFSKVDDQGGAHSFVDVWVTPSFYRLDFQEKSTYVGVVWGYYFEGTEKQDGSEVRVFDNYTGKQIGSYSIWNGGLKLE